MICMVHTLLTVHLDVVSFIWIVNVFSTGSIVCLYMSIHWYYGLHVFCWCDCCLYILVGCCFVGVILNVCYESSNGSPLPSGRGYWRNSVVTVCSRRYVQIQCIKEDMLIFIFHVLFICMVIYASLLKIFWFLTWCHVSVQEAMGTISMFPLVTSSFKCVIHWLCSLSHFP